MKQIVYSCSLGQSEIYLGPLKETLSQKPEYLNAPLIISHQVASFHSWLIQERRSYLFPDDGRKNFDRLKEIYCQFLRWQLDRTSHVIICGGGSLCDLAAFAASTFMRGIPFILVPTTLLSQVDAAIGGKTAVDFGDLKNVIGTFSLPQATLIDPIFLSTLNRSSILDGLAEVVKHALIGSASLLANLQENWSRLINLDPELIEAIILASLQIKIAIVSQDAKEQGKRRLLNFGHTLAHALEKELNLSHGQAVALGMVWAIKLSVYLGLMDKTEAKEILHFLENSFPFISTPPFSLASLERIFSRLEADKKREGEIIHLVLLKKIGEAIIYPLPLSKIKEALHDLCQSGKYLF